MDIYHLQKLYYYPGTENRDLLTYYDTSETITRHIKYYTNGVNAQWIKEYTNGVLKKQTNYLIDGTVDSIIEY